jgi:hypothetical protein
MFAKATQRWNELLQVRFRAAGWGAVRPSCGSILVPLFEEDGVRMGELARGPDRESGVIDMLAARVKRSSSSSRRGSCP